MTSYIAVDIGGTQMRAGCYTEQNLAPVKLDKISTRDPLESPLERLRRLIRSVWPAGDEVAAIAAAAPGPIDPTTGVILTAPNIPGWTNLPLRAFIEEQFHVPTAIGNDANLAALGEWKYGAGAGHHHLIYLTVSTGIGGGVIIDDRLLLGQRGLATELGHITIDPDGPLCGCGQRGHLEALASGTAIANFVSEQIAAGRPCSLPKEKPVSAHAVATAAAQGDEVALEAFNRAGTYLGIAVANFLHIFNPSAVVIGGGVSRSGSLLMDPLNASLRDRILTPGYFENLILTPAAFGDEAGLMGALALARITAADSLQVAK